MEDHEVLEFLLDSFTELATLHVAAARIVERAWSVLAKHNPNVHCGLIGGDFRQEPVLQKRLVIDPTNFSIKWRGQCCNLGPTILFKLIQRFARRPGRYFTYDILMDTVWEKRCSNATVRSAIKRLRRAMRDAGMPELADAIRGQKECYGMFLEDDEP